MTSFIAQQQSRYVVGRHPLEHVSARRRGPQIDCHVLISLQVSMKHACRAHLKACQQICMCMYGCYIATHTATHTLQHTHCNTHTTQPTTRNSPEMCIHVFGNIQIITTPGFPAGLCTCIGSVQFICTSYNGDRVRSKRIEA